PYAATHEQRAAWRYPALTWLDDIMGRFPGREVLAYMPAHIGFQPQPGSGKAARLGMQRAHRRDRAPPQGGVFVDFNIPSEITTNDDNYWDPLHYRLPTAERIVTDIEVAMGTGQDDSDGDYRYLAGPAAGTASPPLGRSR
ncbi:MAG: hypothetical protein MUP20_02000, partial [Methyloceanibacter sp.]|nr:hypothetical protein [Methyloceanibacter sp.]